MKFSWTRSELALLFVPLAVIAAGWLWSVQKSARIVVAKNAPVVAPTRAPIPTPTTPEKIREARAINDIVAAPDGQSLWTINLLDGTRPIHQFSLSAGVWMRAIGGASERWSNALKISPDGRDIIYGDSGQRGKTSYVEIFDAKSGKSRLKLPDGSGTSSVAIAPDGRSFALGYGGYFEIRALSDASLLHRIHWQGGGEVEFLGGACFSSDGQHFAVSDASQSDSRFPDKVGKIGVFSTQTWKPIATYRPPHSYVTVFDFTGANQLAVRSADIKELSSKASVALYNFRTRQTRVLRTRSTGGDYNLAVSPDQKYVATSDDSEMENVQAGDGPNMEQAPATIAEIYDVQSGQKIAASEIRERNVLPCLAFSADSRALFLGAENAKILRWHKSKWNLSQPLQNLSKLALN